MDLEAKGHLGKGGSNVGPGFLNTLIGTRSKSLDNIVLQSTKC